MIALEHIRKTFATGTVNETTLFSDFSFSVAPGEFLSIVGSNGSGKTTLLNLIAGAVPSDAGRILLRGEDITAWPEHRRATCMGRVFQDPSRGVAGSMTIAENLAMADAKGRPSGLHRGLDRRRLAYYRERLAALGLGLEDKLHTPVAALSGGQRQALSLLMATLVPPDLLILDEHTAALDPRTADQLMELTDRIVKEQGLTALMVTHNLRYAVEYGTRLVMMHAGQIVLDRQGEEKQKTTVPDVLDLFNQISIECGN